MASEWETYEIGEIADIVGGGTPSTKDAANFDGGIPWLTPKDLSLPHGRYVSGGARTISDEGLRRSSARLMPAGTVLLSTRAPVGYVAIAAGTITTNQGFRSLVLKEGFLPEFVYYWLLQNTEELERHASGSTFRELSGSALKRIKIRVPPLPEQRVIAHILGTLDDKIELNRRMARTLEEMARTLFKAWFVDFEPVRAKMEGRWRRGESLPGLPAHLYDLFPDRLVDSELGPIPEGWEVRPVGGLADVVGGTTPSTKVAAYWEGGTHCWATPRDLAGLAHPVLLGTERRVTDSGLSKTGSGLLPVGTVLLSSRAPIGYLAVAEVPVAINQGFIAMRPKQGIASVFLLMWAEIANDEIMSRANGSTFLEISKGNFRPIPVVVPSESAMRSFEKHAGGYYRRIVDCVRQTQVLTEVRSALLPRLVSGEVRVTNSDRVLVEVGHSDA